MSDLSRDEWRCFHCDEVFTDRTAARRHFGDVLDDMPACLESLRNLWAMLKLDGAARNWTLLERAVMRLRSENKAAKAPSDTEGDLKE